MDDVARFVLQQLPARFSKRYLTPERLASLFILASAVRTSYPEFGDTVENLLLDYTIRHAVASCAWYQEHIEISKTCRFFGKAFITTLPIFTREDLESHLSGFRAQRLSYGFSTFTTGTTSGHPLIVDRSLEEQRFISRFFECIQPKGKKPLTLQLVNTFHGQLLEIPLPYQQIIASINSLGGLRTVRNLLLREYQVAGRSGTISAIGGSLISLLRLTSFLESERIDEKIPRMAFLQTTSEYMTPHAHKRLQDFWHCTIENRYGLSEIFLGAWLCHVCGRFHFEPYGIPEVVGLKSTTAVHSGRGRLVLTSFFPFIQMNPMIRYDTGDGVELFEGECLTGYSGVRILGRISRSIVLNDEDLFLGENEVMDVLDGESDVMRPRMYRELPLHLQEVGAPPDFELRTSKGGAPELCVRLRYEPSSFPQRVNQLRARIRSALGRPTLRILFEYGAGGEKRTS